jgi:hypothetical protein
MLAPYVNRANRADWDDYLPLIMIGYNSHPHTNTGMSPYLMTLAREANLPIDLMVDTGLREYLSPCSSCYVQWLREAFYDIENRMRGLHHKAASRQKQMYDSTRPRRLRFKRADWVLRLHEPSKKAKLQLPQKGPYQVLKRIDQNHYLIKESKDKDAFQEHIDRLEPYYAAETEQLESLIDDDKIYPIPMTKRIRYRADVGRTNTANGRLFTIGNGRYGDSKSFHR